jgi:hypothetical protein
MIYSSSKVIITAMPHILSRSKLIRRKPSKNARRLRSISSRARLLPENETPVHVKPAKTRNDDGMYSGTLPIPIKPIKGESHIAKIGFHHGQQGSVETTFLPRIPLIIPEALSDDSSCSLSLLPYCRTGKGLPSSSEDSLLSRREGTEGQQVMNPISSFVVPSVSGSISPLTLPPSFSEPWTYCSYVDYPSFKETQDLQSEMHHQPSPTSVLVMPPLYKSNWQECDQDKKVTKPSFFILDDEIPRSNLHYALEQYDSSRKSWVRGNFPLLDDLKDERCIFY